MFRLDCCNGLGTGFVRELLRPAKSIVEGKGSFGRIDSRSGRGSQDPVGEGDDVCEDGVVGVESVLLSTSGGPLR